MSEINNDLDMEVVHTAKPLTQWKNEPTAADLKKDFQESSGDHDLHVANVGRWLDNLNVVGAAKVAKVKGRSSITPKLIRKQAEWRYAALSEAFLSDTDLFDTEPVSWEDGDAAIQNGLVLNNQFNTKINKVAFIDEYVRTLVDEGTAIIRTGWEFEEEEVEVPDMQPRPITNPEQIDSVIETIQMLEQNPAAMLEDMQLTLEAGQPMEMVEVGTKLEMKTIKNQPTVEVCEYKSVVIDPSCKGDLAKAGFIIFSFEIICNIFSWFLWY